MSILMGRVSFPQEHPPHAALKITAWGEWIEFFLGFLPADSAPQPGEPQLWRGAPLICFSPPEAREGAEVTRQGIRDSLTGS